MSAFRASRALRVIQQATRPGKQSFFMKNLFTDTGNIPLVIANGAGASLVFIFGARKFLFHPDIGVSEANRFNDAVQNETQSRLDDADAYREQHIAFAKFLQPLADPLMRMWTGNSTNSPKWRLDFAQTPVHELKPLESSSYFNDGMYENVPASDYAKPDNNYNFEKYKH